MAFKMKGFSAFTKKDGAYNKMTDPPVKTDNTPPNIQKMLAEYEKLEKKENRTEKEEAKMKQLGYKLDEYYGDDTRG